MAMAAATPEPFSPSLFLDLPPTPHKDDQSDDDILPYISRMLMEEDMDDQFFYHFPDHPALLQAQQPYAQILSASDDSSGNATNSSISSSSPPDATANSAWSYDPVELSGQLLQPPPYLDMANGYADDLQWPEGTADGSSFISAAHNGGTTVRGDEADPNISSLPSTGLDGGQQAAMASAFFDGQTGNMLSLAFLRGMEEASKFLPTTTNLLADVDAAASPVMFFRGDTKPASTFIACSGRGRKNSRHAGGDDLEVEAGRSNKLMIPEQEETRAGEMLDEIMFNGYELCLKGMEELRISMSSDGDKKKSRKAAPSAAEVVDLRTMLIHCAQAVATGDSRGATEMLVKIKRHSSPRGDAAQRLAHFFGEGLEARLAGTGSGVYRSLVAQRTSAVEFLKAYMLFFVACPFNKAKFTFDNTTIMHAVAGKRRLHIIDYGVGYGFQWPTLLQQLACREGGPPEVRITGIDTPQPGFRPAFQIEETGRRLSNCAHQYGVPFKFHAVAARWETVVTEDLDLDPDEVLVVNTQRGLNGLMDGSVDMDGGDGLNPRDVVLRNIRNMRPDVFIQWVVNGTYGAPFFLTRFREALFYYSAYFDVLDATIPRDNDERLLIERDLFGRCALNVVACEGVDRVERPETYKQWQVRNHRAGLRQLPLDPDVVKMVRDKVKNNNHKDFMADIDQRWLLQGWKGRVLYHPAPFPSCCKGHVVV